MEPLISIIVPIYNTEEYLPRCLDSIVGQTYQNLEIILIDDGSKDGSGAICDNYALADNRIKVLHQQNSGVAAARNKGLNAANGEFLMFVDSDDRIMKNAVGLLFDRLTRDESELAVGKHIRVCNGKMKDDPNWSWMDTEVWSVSDALTAIGEGIQIFLGTTGKLFRKELLEGIVIPELLCGEDTWIFPEYISRCRNISIVDENVYEYHFRSDSITRSRSDKILMDALKAELHVTEFLLSSGYEQSGIAWFSYALGPVLAMRNKKAGIQLIRDQMGDTALKQLLRKLPMRTKIKWLATHSPIISKMILTIRQYMST